MTKKKLNPLAPVAPSVRPWPVNPVELNLSAATSVAPHAADETDEDICASQAATVDDYDISAILKEKVQPPRNDVMNGSELYMPAKSLVIRDGAMNFKNHSSRGFRC